jgi:hypothetical protein
MFTEIIAVYSEITAEYINHLWEQNSENCDVITNDTYRYLCGLKLENISLALQIISGRTKV